MVSYGTNLSRVWNNIMLYIAYGAKLNICYKLYMVRTGFTLGYEREIPWYEQAKTVRTDNGTKRLWYEMTDIALNQCENRIIFL